MRITVIGATAGIGRAAVEEALARGHNVCAFARGADKMEPREGLRPCVGDALEPADVAGAIAGADAVIYALGVKHEAAMLWRDVTLFSETTRILLEAMGAAQVQRLLVITGFGAGRSRASMSKLERLGHWALLGRPYADKDRQEPLVMQSDTHWTIARPVILTNSARTGKYRALRRPEEWRNGLISRADVAVYLLDAVEQDLDIRGDVVLAR